MKIKLIKLPVKASKLTRENTPVRVIMFKKCLLLVSLTLLTPAITQLYAVSTTARATATVLSSGGTGTTGTTTATVTTSSTFVSPSTVLIFSGTGGSYPASLVTVVDGSSTNTVVEVDTVAAKTSTDHTTQIEGSIPLLTAVKEAVTNALAKLKASSSTTPPDTLLTKLANVANQPGGLSKEAIT